VESVAHVIESDGAATGVFVVRCRQKADAGIALATLRLACGEDTLDLPLSAIGGPTGP